nr:hypothetical protein [Leifsonia sp. Leaf325]
MRAASHSYTLVGAVLLALGLSTIALAGCAASPKPLPSASSTPTASPVFASDEEALAAAEEAYAAYQKVSDAVGHDGGAEPERYEAVATGDALENALKSARQYRDADATLTGSTSFSTQELQSAEYAKSEALEIVLYVCDDVSLADIVDATGTSIVKPDRQTVLPFVLTVVGSADQLQVSEKVLWDGKNFCP